MKSSNTFNLKIFLITVTYLPRVSIKYVRTTRKITKYSCVDEDTFIPRQSKNRSSLYNEYPERRYDNMGQLKKLFIEITDFQIFSIE